mmetsp:Transcript_25623/g.52167  ORF Transcript_25623/g.52167 Transcript_25623/m.52167 type:complete len:142 (-) Transcript_25623:326-751(-)
MARDAGANKVYLTSAAPPIRYPNIYGIDIPTRKELVAYERDEEQIAKILGCDWVVYQRLGDLEDSVRESGDCPEHDYETSCFSGTYVTGENINDEYFAKLHDLRNDSAKETRLKESTNGLPPGSHDGCENLSNDKRVRKVG